MNSTLTALLPHLTAAKIQKDAPFSGVSTNSKTVEPGNLFVALRGERFDAHDFLHDVVARGATAVIVEHLPADLPIPAIVVEDTKKALAELAVYWRKQFHIPVIGVTGSNGKTTVKEMIASILTAAYGADNILATRGNLNNDIGVPLTVFRMNSQHRAAVIELGMNHPGEIAELTKIAQPTVALVNNAQREHQEFMATVEAVALENGSVLQGLPHHGVAVYPAEDAYTPLWGRLTQEDASRASLTFGLTSEAHVRGSYKALEFGSRLDITVKGRPIQITLAAAGEHNVRNALAAIACSYAIGVQLNAIVDGLNAFQPVSGRLQRKQASSGATVIDDTYNANPDSVKAAIDVLAQSAGPRMLVLGDMGEVGSEGAAFHREIGEYAQSRGVETLITVGELCSHADSSFIGDKNHYGNMQELLREVGARSRASSTILVKGSRFMKMEQVVKLLTGESAPQSTHL